MIKRCRQLHPFILWKISGEIIGGWQKLLTYLADYNGNTIHDYSTQIKLYKISKFKCGQLIRIIYLNCDMQSEYIHFTIKFCN